MQVVKIVRQVGQPFEIGPRHPAVLEESQSARIPRGDLGAPGVGDAGLAHGRGPRVGGDLQEQAAGLPDTGPGRPGRNRQQRCDEQVAELSHVFSFMPISTFYPVRTTEFQPVVI
ncbi:MAG: hypothetical protein F4Y17_10790 [Gemmatimonadetes bacterium]|nr:hypothetical protein [Gemmatimonadota bacterium]